MMIDQIPRRYSHVLWLSVFLLVPSFDTVGKYFGLGGIIAYFLIGLFVVYVGHFLLLPFFLRHVTERTALILAVTTFLGLIAIVSVGYPLANSGRYGGGADVDDAMIIAVGELVKGNYPYYLKTYLGLPISPLPGAILIAFPWVLAGALQYQNIFWLAVLFIFLRREMRSYAYPLALFWAILLLSPTVHQSLVTGSDYISNSIYVLIPVWLILKGSRDADASVWSTLLPAAFLGFGLSSRSNFLLVVPMIFIFLGRTAGWKRALLTTGVAMAAFAAVTLPFWAYDPAGFSPISTQAAKVLVLEQALPLAGKLIPGTALIIAVILSFRQTAWDVAAFFRNSGIVQLYLLIFSSVVYAVQTDQLNLYMGNSGYGLFALFFGAVGSWLFLTREENAPSSTQVLKYSMQAQLD